MQRQIFNNMLGSSYDHTLYTFIVLQYNRPLEGSHDVAHSENEFDTPDLLYLHIARKSCSMMQDIQLLWVFVFMRRVD